MRYIILASLLFSCISAEITTHDTQETTQNDYNGGVECGLCLWGTEKIEDYLEANYTETKLENEMTALCNDIPGQFGELCQQLIVPNIPVIIEKMEEKETPDTICQQLHACDSVDIISIDLMKNSSPSSPSAAAGHTLISLTSPCHHCLIPIFIK